MINIEDMLKIQQTVQMGSVMKAAASSVAKGINANADDAYIDNAARIEDRFGTVMAEQYLLSVGVLKPQAHVAPGKHTAP